MATACAAAPSETGATTQTSVAPATATPPTTATQPSTTTTPATPPTNDPAASGAETQTLVLDSGWSIEVPVGWLVADDPATTASFAAGGFEGDYGDELVARAEAMGEYFELAAIGEGLVILFAASLPAYPKRYDLALAESGLQAAFEQSPLAVHEIDVERVDISGADYGILGRVIYTDPELGELMWVSLTLGTGDGDDHLTVQITATTSDQELAEGIILSVARATD